LCHIAPEFGSSARRIEGCISGYVTFNATKADEPKAKQDGAIILYRAGFISTAISEGIYDVLSNGPANLENIQSDIGTDLDKDGLKA
jgi:prolyl-tRNA synthetase